MLRRNFDEVLEVPKERKMDRLFGTWNVTCQRKSRLLKTIARELEMLKNIWSENLW
jgi:hypothetical protein